MSSSRIVWTTRFFVGAGALAMFGCDPISVGGASGSGGGGAGGGAATTTTTTTGTGGPLPKATKVDILLTLDNSRSMGDKQEVLSLAMADLVQGLTNPPCVTPDGERSQPASSLDACPTGAIRAYPPVHDAHLGIISSSLGGHGGDTCRPDLDGPSAADMARLLARSSSDVANDLPTYQNKGFLAWDPGAAGTPPGESDPQALLSTFKDMVLGVGQFGCGFEAPLESWYRFLVDPEPYASISVQNNQAVPQGVDTALLQQRADFLRPDSMLVILVLSDEDDCSIRDEKQGFLAAQRRLDSGEAFHLWRPRSECAVDPNDACCKSCNQDRGDCPVDPSCGSDPANPLTLAPEEDQINLRCFDQKRRFGFDFLYPTDRYTQALTSATIANRAGELVPNPIFSDLVTTDASTTIRDPGLVVMAGIVGVPWQDLARDPQDLSLGYKSAAEIARPLPSGGTTWDVVLGDPAVRVAPGDPLMVASVDPRSGVNPITGDPVGAPGTGGNPMNGSERTIAYRDDLQYSCVFPIRPRDCADVAAESVCECAAPENADNPLCAPGLDGNSLQVNAKAYPGLRELSVLKSIGEQGVTASICPAQTTDTARADYGYRPIMRALLERIAPRL